MSGWDFQQDLCRCCHATGKFLALSTGLTDDLSCAAVLQTYMDINISPIPGVLSEITYRICNNCYIRLKDASEFKNQVQQCEEKFKDMFSDMNVVKIEVDPVDDDIIQEFHDDVDMQSNDGDVKEEVDKKACKMTKVKSESSKKKANSDSDDDGWSDDDDDIIKPLTFEEPPKLKLSDLPKSFSEDKKQRLLNCIDEVTNTNMTIVDAAKKYGINNNVLWYWVNKQKNKNNKKKKTDPKASTSEAAGYRVMKIKQEKKSTIISFPTNPSTSISNTMPSNNCPPSYKDPPSSSNFIDYRKKMQFKYQCPKCDEKLPNATQVYLHLKSEHMKHWLDSEFVCLDDCKKKMKYPNLERLVSHIRLVHCRRECPDCPLWLRKLDLIKHRDKEHAIPMPACGVCDYKDVERMKILKHQRKVHLREKHVTCNDCGMLFFDNNDLKTHAVKHGSDKKYKCRFCNKSFLRSRTLQCHERIHTGEKNKECKVCGERFVQKASLNYHMGKHHPGEPF